MITKHDLVGRLADILEMSQAQIALFMDSYANVMASALAHEDEAVLPGIGRLSAETVPAHPGRKPFTGEPIEIPEKVKIRFKASKSFTQNVAIKSAPSEGGL